MYPLYDIIVGKKHFFVPPSICSRKVKFHFEIFMENRLLLRLLLDMYGTEKLYLAQELFKMALGDKIC